MALRTDRVWAMPNAQTFKIPPIAALLDRWVEAPSVDPFARDSARATWTNDLNPATTAQAHLPADLFCTTLADSGVRAQTVLFDPPYSPRQISECYRIAGLAVTTSDTQNAALYKRVRDALDELLMPGGIAISMGWNTVGFGKDRGYELVELLIVCHGGAHNDTLVTVERKALDS